MKKVSRKLYPNQSGQSPLVLLFMIVLGVFLIWEANEFINTYVASNSEAGSGAVEEGGGTYCKTGEEGNCNDSNDVFLFSE